MTSDLPNRQSIRLKGYDYSQNGVYFVTICSQSRENIFGVIKNNQMIMNDVGIMARKWWCKIENKFTSVKLDEYVIMPNHLHGIICLTKTETGEYMDSPLPINNTYKGIGQKISWFKRMFTNEYIEGVKNLGWETFDKKIWQRNYYEHIIRDEHDFMRYENIFQTIHKNGKQIHYTCRGESMYSPV